MQTAGVVVPPVQLIVVHSGPLASLEWLKIKYLSTDLSCKPIFLSGFSDVRVARQH